MNRLVERNYLEINSLNELIETIPPSKDIKLELLNPPDFNLSKFFYKQIGKKYQWIDRLNWTNQKWINYISQKNILTFVLKDKSDVVGFYELIFNTEKKGFEISYFGIFEEYFGKRLGGFLLSDAIKRAFSLGAEKVFVHTCSLDHKNALKNYLNRGMKIFKEETINLNLT